MLNIAIDGPAGAGKSTVAKIIAKDLDILYLDTGAMYRAVALTALRNNIKPADIDGVKTLLDGLDIKVGYSGGNQITYLNGEDVSEAIREHSISKAASDISAIPEVRLRLVELQRKIAKVNNLVMDGRDIGTYVLPETKYKFYLTASADVRAERRYSELTAKGQKADLINIKNDIIERDYNDMNRDFAPLCCADDAVYIDSSDMTAEQVKVFILNIVTGKGGR